MTEPQFSRAKEFRRDICEEHGKMLFRSRHDALGSLQGGMRSKRVRVYPCGVHSGLYHLSKETVKYQRHKQRKRT